jgi:23S rRNA (cytosine1962-C5)-methyltransferase
MMTNSSIQLKPKRDLPVRRHHPWIFAGAIEAVSGEPEAGDPVDVFSDQGEWLAKATYSPLSQIRARIWTWTQGEEIDAVLIDHRIELAFRQRDSVLSGIPTDSYRLIFSESDSIPGLIVDRYGDVLVFQILSFGVERYRGQIISSLQRLVDCRAIMERSDTEVRGLEGLPPRSELAWGELEENEIEIFEHDLRFRIDIREGHKTGFYLDQRDNRQTIRKFITQGEVLDCFCYSGAFGLNVLQSGADQVIAIDSSQNALDLAQKNRELNKISSARWQPVASNVFDELRQLRDRGRSFDAIILDPPRFAPTSSHVSKASRGYKDINLLAMKLLKPDGILATFSCSGGITPEVFQKIVTGAALDAGVQVQILAWLSQPADHPVNVFFPEGRYLKGFICRVHS